MKEYWKDWLKYAIKQPPFIILFTLSVLTLTLAIFIKPIVEEYDIVKMEKIGTKDYIIYDSGSNGDLTIKATDEVKINDDGKGIIFTDYTLKVGLYMLSFILIGGFFAFIQGIKDYEVYYPMVKYVQSNNINDSHHVLKGYILTRKGRSYTEYDIKREIKSWIKNPDAYPISKQHQRNENLNKLLS